MPALILPAAGLAALLTAVFGLSSFQTADDPALRAAVERYYQALEAEDVEAYLALWSQTAQRPQRESLDYLFKTADERFSEIQILRTSQANERVRVRLSVRRVRTSEPRVPGGPPLVIDRVTTAAISFRKEAGAWKVLSEGSPADDLAAAYLAADGPSARDALLAAEPDMMDRMLVLAAARIASQAAMMQQYARAETLSRRVLELARRAGSREDEGETLQNLGTALYFQRKFPEALAAYEERLRVEAERGDDEAAAAAYGGVGTVRYSLAEYAQALDAYRRALAIQERVDDKLAAATSLISIGNIRYLQGDYPAAIREYSRSRDLFRATSNPDGDARALEGLGRTYFAQGDLAGALGAFTAVLADGRARGDRSRQAVATQSIGDVHLRLGNLEAARSSYTESRDHFFAAKDTASAGRVWQSLGMTELIAGRFEQAEEGYATSVSTCTAAADAECTAHGVLGLAFAQSTREKFPEAVHSYRKAIDRFSAIGAREAAARAEVGLSQALAGMRNFPGALEAAARARRAAIALEEDDVLWRALTAEARSLRASGALGDAVAAARAAAGVVERMHEEAAAKPGTAIPSDAFAAFATLAVLQAESGDAQASWETAARLRAVSLRSRLAVNEREIWRGMTQEERDRERAVAADVLSLLAQSARERGSPRPDKGRLALLDERIAAASAVRTRWMEELYAKLPDLRLWRGLAAVPDRDGILRAAGPSALILEFVVDDDDVLAFATSAADDWPVAVQRTGISRRTLAERVSALLQVQVLGDAEAWRNAVSEVVDLLPAAALPRLASASRVIVLPHDVIWRVPFEALLAGGGFVSERTQVIYAGSRTALLRSSQADTPAVTSVAAISAPALARALEERLQQVAPGWHPRPVESASRETNAIAAIYSEEAVVLDGAAATEAAARDTLPPASVLHLAAPFRINGASPLFSPVLLAGTPAVDGPENDGTLEAREVMNLTLAARVAVLSDGAAMSMRDGAASAEIVQWAWLAAGVGAVLMPRWTSDPEASDALLVDFHRRMRAGEDPAEALHGARNTVRSRPGWAAPYYWAGWMLLGI